jgi:hypothetical protein
LRSKAHPRRSVLFVLVYPAGFVFK